MLLWPCALLGNVVINEIHYNPDIKTELVEFVELYNSESTDIDLTGWYFKGGISYEFAPGSTLPADGYIIVAENPSQIQTKWSSGRFVLPPSLVFGPFEGKLDNSGDTIELCDAHGNRVDRVDYQLGFPWPTVGDAVPEDQPGTGHSIQLVNPFLDNNLAGNWRSALPTPLARNDSVWLDNPPPDIRQVENSPKQPKSGQIVTVTAKVTDPNGVASVTLSYQIVEPGSYINLTDPQYNANWTDVKMNDRGLDGDEIAGDDIYSAQLPGSMQVHRRLIRYRITAVDSTGQGLVVPYMDDPQPNFAYFVYDGVPPWRGAVQPGVTPVLEFGTDVMRSVPVYHLISKESDVEAATWLEKYAGAEYKWYGTLVYDGDVYDHIRYRARGGVWRYAMGKNMWKFNFNRGHRFQASDDHGKKYATKWDKLNFSACIQQGSFGQRGEQGMFEALSFKLFNMAGVSAPKTNWVEFRVIDEANEDGTLNAAHPPLTSHGTQYDGDFWGLYMNIEQMDGRFLDEHHLPDGNLYKMDPAYPDGCKLNNQGPTGVTDKSDVIGFRNSYSSNPSAAWWGSNVNLETYYSYYTIYHAVWHGDITSKNHFFYLDPEPITNEWGTNLLWSQLPWDLDLTWTCYYSNVKDPFSLSGVLNHPVLDTECRNRVRELWDLLFNPEQMNQLIDEFAAVIDDPGGGLSIVDADRAMWDYHWVMGDGAYPRYLSYQASFKAGQGRFYQEAVKRGYPRTFAGMVQVMKYFVVERQSHMSSICSDPAIPRTPTVTATCPPTYPINALTFQTSPFSDPQGSGTFGAMKWRIAEVASDSLGASQSGNPAAGGEGKYEINAVWESPEMTTFERDITIPASAVKVGHTYRVRCRMKDNTNRWSHWSAPVQFVAGEPLAAHILDNLRITELMYNPSAPPGDGAADKDDFEFIELKNIGNEAIDLTSVSFTAGITFDFGQGKVHTLAPGEFVLVVKNQAAFESRYGTDLSSRITGQYSGQLSNSGETVSLVDLWNGTVAEFTYSDGRGWPLAADGGGHSLVPLSSALPGERDGSLNYGGNWRASTYIGGSPGRDDPEPQAVVVLNEVMAHTDYSDPQHPQQESNDWIELYNTTTASVSLRDCYLSDDVGELKKWSIPAVQIPARSYISFDEVTGFHISPDTGFGLNKAGEEVVLSYLPGTSEDRIIDCIGFKGQPEGTSLGRYPDGGTYWFQMAPSRDAANANPISSVVIDELMYHPAATDDEYIELYNPTAKRVYLESPNGPWRLSGAVDYTFPRGISIPADGRSIVVGFDPYTDIDRLAAFVAGYKTTPLMAGVNIVGPWSGNLSNAGERLALEMPQAPDLPGDPISWIIVDEVIYADLPPWPQTADGAGDALERISSDPYHSGNDPANWTATSPSPDR
jgi:Lamin Tail Domain/CotH kinase protein